MSQITIEVRGEARVEAAPERALVRAAVTADGPEPQPVAEQVTAVVAGVRVALQALQAQGAVRTFTIDEVHVSAHRPWNESGAQLPLVHTATVAIGAEFLDARELGRWVFTDGLTVHGVEWDVDEATRAALERDVRHAAVRDAVARAQDYADAIGAGPVHAVAIEEPGVTAAPRMLRAMADSGPALDLVPPPVEVLAQVQARFLAGE